MREFGASVDLVISISNRHLAIGEHLSRNGCFENLSARRHLCSGRADTSLAACLCKLCGECQHQRSRYDSVDGERREPAFSHVCHEPCDRKVGDDE